MNQRNGAKRVQPWVLAARLGAFSALAPVDAETIPIGSMIRTPSGKLAKVEGYRGYKRDSCDTRTRLVCRYVEPENKRFGVVQLLPELAEVIRGGEGARATPEELTAIGREAVDNFMRKERA